MADVLDGEKLTYEELVEILASQSARIQRLEEYVSWLNREIAAWAEFETNQTLALNIDVSRYKLPYKRFDELDKKITNYITFNESKLNNKAVEMVDLVETVDLVGIVEAVEKVENGRS